MTVCTQALYSSLYDWKCRNTDLYTMLHNTRTMCNVKYLSYCNWHQTSIFSSSFVFHIFTLHDHQSQNQMFYILMSNPSYFHFSVFLSCHLYAKYCEALCCWCVEIYFYTYLCFDWKETKKHKCDTPHQKVPLQLSKNVLFECVHM